MLAALFYNARLTMMNLPDGKAGEIDYICRITCSTMTKEELLIHLQNIEWDDFEAKEAQNKVPANVWETVSAFSNTSGGWIVFGIKQIGKKFEVQGVSEGEHIESDFLNTLRSGQKMN